MTTKMKLLIVCLLLLVALIVFPLFFSSMENMENEDLKTTDVTTDEVDDLEIETENDSDDVTEFESDSPEVTESELETDDTNNFTEQSTIAHDTIMNSLENLHRKMDSYEGKLNETTNMNIEEDNIKMEDLDDAVIKEDTTQMTDKCNIELSDEMARCYLNRHIDLQEMFGYNLKKAKKHWKTQGCLEKRSYACKGKSEVVNETSETSQIDERITYVGPNGNKLYVYEGDNGKVIEGPNGTRYVVSNPSSETRDTIEEIINNESSQVSGVKITKYTGEDGKEMIVIKRTDGSTIIVGPNGEIANIDTSFQNNPVRMYGHDKYILKTQVVPPVCPGCPGLGPSVYANENTENVIENRENIVENRQEITENAIENRQEIAQEIVDNRQEIVDTRQQIAQNAIQNSPQTREQSGTIFSGTNMQYKPDHGELLGNNLDSYEPQSMLTDFSNFA